MYLFFKKKCICFSKRKCIYFSYSSVLKKWIISWICETTMMISVTTMSNTRSTLRKLETLDDVLLAWWGTSPDNLRYKNTLFRILSERRETWDNSTIFNNKKAVKYKDENNVKTVPKPTEPLILSIVKDLVSKKMKYRSHQQKKNTEKKEPPRLTQEEEEKKQIKGICRDEGITSLLIK